MRLTVPQPRPPVNQNRLGPTRPQSGNFGRKCNSSEIHLKYYCIINSENTCPSRPIRGHHRARPEPQSLTPHSQRRDHLHVQVAQLFEVDDRNRIKEWKGEGQDGSRAGESSVRAPYLPKMINSRLVLTLKSVSCHDRGNAIYRSCLETHGSRGDTN